MPQIRLLRQVARTVCRLRLGHANVGLIALAGLAIMTALTAGLIVVATGGAAPIVSSASPAESIEVTSNPDRPTVTPAPPVARAQVTADDAGAFTNLRTASASVGRLRSDEILFDEATGFALHLTGSDGLTIGTTHGEANASDSAAPRLSEALPGSEVALQSELDDRQTVQVTVWVSVTQMQGEIVAGALGGQPFIECDLLISKFALYIKVGPTAGLVPCVLDVAIGG